MDYCSWFAISFFLNIQDNVNKEIKWQISLCNQHIILTYKVTGGTGIGGHIKGNNVPSFPSHSGKWLASDICWLESGMTPNCKKFASETPMKDSSQKEWAWYSPQYGPYLPMSKEWWGTWPNCKKESLSLWETWTNVPQGIQPVNGIQ